jgi:hypothetical protein
MEYWNGENTCISLSKQKIVKWWGTEVKKKNEVTRMKLSVTWAYIIRSYWTQSEISSDC